MRTHEISVDMNGAVHCAGHGWHFYVLGIAPPSRVFLFFVRKWHSRLPSTACAHVVHFLGIPCAADKL